MLFLFFQIVQIQAHQTEWMRLKWGNISLLVNTGILRELGNIIVRPKIEILREVRVHEKKQDGTLFNITTEID